MKYTITLEGCRPEPMASYLKALGVLRLVCEQVDSHARGSWSGNSFRLESSLDLDGLVRFFLEHYSPTPIVAPWNSGSGFYDKDRKDGIDAILSSSGTRFEEYRQAIHAIQQSEELAAMAAQRKAAKAGKTARVDGKEVLVRACRSRLCDRAVDWIDAAIVMRADGDLAYPPVLGTAGNEGRLDYTNTFMCRLSELLLQPNPDAPGLLRNSLTGGAASGLVQSPTGQYDPGRAGGYNQGPGIESKDFPANPWNFVLSMEGAVAWTGGVGRRQGVGLPRHTVSPFTVSASAVGYGSATEADIGTARAEIWMPLWTRPARFEEIRQLLREGRADIGRRPASSGLQFAEAATALGVDRGVDSFVRYNLLKRRGDSYIALPAGRFPVRHLKATDLLSDIEPYFAFLARAIQPMPARIEAARRNVDRAVFAFVSRGTDVEFRGIVEALGRVEMEVWLRSTRRENGDLKSRPPLRPEWLRHVDDSIEVRVAAAIASIRRTGHVAEISEYLRAGYWTGSSIEARAASLLHRRMIDGARTGCERNPLYGLVCLRASDICAFRDAACDGSLIEALLFGFTLIDWAHPRSGDVCEDMNARWREPLADRAVSRSWALLKHLFLPRPYKARSGEEVSIRPEPSVIPLLRAGRVDDACCIAYKRLHASGLAPIKAELGKCEEGIRLAGALLVPIRQVDEISRLVLEDQEKATTSGR